MRPEDNADAIESGSKRPPTNLTAIQLLERAKQLIQGGWCQGVSKRLGMNGHPDEYCLAGALGHASWGDDHERFISGLMDQAVYNYAEVAVERAVSNIKPDARYVAWNDQPERTQAEVLALLDSAKQLLLQDVPL